MKWNMAVPTVVGSLILAACAETTTAPLMSTGPGRVPAKTISVGGEQSGNGCQSGDGYVKIDASSGSASGAWGSFTYSGTQVNGTVNLGYTLELCLKYATSYQVTTVTGLQSGLLAQTPSTGPNGQRQGISHMAWRVTGSPPTTLLQSLSVSKGATATYTRTVDWKLTKKINENGSLVESVVRSALIGQQAPPAVNWDVVADKSEVESDRLIVGAVTVSNPNPVSVGVSVLDVLQSGSAGNYTDLPQLVSVDCGSGTANGTVPARSGNVDGVLVCNYTVSPSDKSATLNRASVTVDQSSYTPPEGFSGQITGGNATAAITWVETLIGDESVTFADARNGNYSTVISNDATLKFAETFSCPSDRSLYVNQLYSFTVTNIAKLDGVVTHLTDDAKATINCKDPYAAETATGLGTKWSSVVNGVSNWFMFTTIGAMTAVDQNSVLIGTDLIAGQFYDVGQITAVVNGATTSITITLQNNAMFSDVGSNVKILPMSSCKPNKYVQPGQYTYKTTASGGSSTVEVPSAPCYAIHVDVLRYAP
jgi:hypothetical protein